MSIDNTSAASKAKNYFWAMSQYTSTMSFSINIDNILKISTVILGDPFPSYV